MTARQTIDLARLRRAMRDLEVTGGAAGRVRCGAIADAIKAIQEDGAGALHGRFIGVKNYAAFGDQREDHSYGMGPRHGTIVFRIGRKRVEGDPVLGPDHVYLLECVRDCGTIETKIDLGRRDGRDDGKRMWNVTEVVAYADRCEHDAVTTLCVLDGLTVESHEMAEGGAA